MQKNIDFIELTYRPSILDGEDFNELDYIQNQQ